MSRDPIPLSSALDGVVQSLRGPSRKVVGGVFGRWDELVGPQVAGHVRPLKLDEGVLTVEVDDSAWATQMKFLSSMVIDRLAEVVDVRIERIDIRVAGHRR